MGLLKLGLREGGGLSAPFRNDGLTSWMQWLLNWHPFKMLSSQYHAKAMSVAAVGCLHESAQEECWLLVFMNVRFMK